jgi:hypothetical protein
MNYMRSRLVLLIFFFTFFLAACMSSGSAPQAIEGYIRALTEKDVVAATGASCLAWEEAAFAEASSFEAVEVNLEGLRCVESGSDSEFTHVKCEGKIIANYGGELQDIDLSQRTYLALSEQGEWKMCGYASN